MATNTAITASLVSNPVSPSQGCVATPQDIVDLVSNYVTVNITDPAAVDPSTGSSIANQALNTANIALTTAQATQASIPQRRSVNQPVPVSTSDSNFVITWQPAMPDTNYEVRGTFYGPANGTGSRGEFYVVDSTRTVDGCTIRLVNVASGMSFAWVVEDLSVT